MRFNYILRVVTCLLLLPVALPAQDVSDVEGTLTGTVNAAGSGQPLEFASVSIHDARDSSLVTGDVTDIDGNFSIDLPPGRYYASIEFLSFQAQVVPEIVMPANGADVDLGLIKMREDATTLSEVEVTAEKSQMELKLDRRVFNVGKDLTNAGANAAEVLDNVPSINVDVEGNVTLRGSGGVRILINGRPSGLIGNTPDALRQLQGSLIERIEVITNPSARYEAEGEVGIINIILKKDNRSGLNGTVGLTAGYPDNYGASYGLNYRRNNINLFSNFGVNYRGNPGEGRVYQENYLPEGTFIYETDRRTERNELGGNLRLGLDWFINDKTTLTAAALGRYEDENNNATLVYRDYIPSVGLINTTTRTNDEDEQDQNIEFNVTLRREFTSPEHVWTFESRFYDDRETSEGLYNTVSTNDEAPPLQRSISDELSRNWLFQTDFVRPVNEEGRFELGARAGLRLIENDFLAEEQDSALAWQVLPSLDDELRYTENIYAAYSQFGDVVGRFSYQLGLRAEYSDITTELLQTGASNPRDYLSLFPSAFLSYKIGEENQFQLSYSRRISRPWFRMLLPFFNISDNRNNFAGNPNLDPEFTNSFEGSYLLFFGKGSLLSSIYYRHRTGVIQRINILNDEGITLRFPVNLSTQDAYGFEFNFSYDLADWWTATANVNLYRAITEGEYEGQRLFADTYTASGRLNTKITFPGKIDFQTNVRYRAPERTPQGRELSQTVVDLGLARDIFKGKGTLALSVRDLFNQRRHRSITETAEFYSENEFQWRARQVLLTLNYRINQSKRQQGREGRGEGGEFEGGDDMGF